MARYRTEYSDKIDLFYSKFLRSSPSNAVLTGSSLVYFIRNMSLFGLETIHTEPYSGEIKKVQPRDTERHRINIPLEGVGERLDKITENWSEWPQFNNVKGEIQFTSRSCNGQFFTPERRKNAHELIAGMLKCGEEAGIRDKMFLGFGGLLGYALIGDFLWNDDDIDICILADDIPQEQLRKYLIICMDAKLTEHRLHGPETINRKYVWFSIGNKSVATENGVKACNWFWFKHANHYWHSKGAKWTKEYSAKGIPKEVFDGKLKEVTFGGNKINIPVNVGACLDWWYGSWVEERNESSRATTTLRIGNEEDRSTWIMRR